MTIGNCAKGVCPGIAGLLDVKKAPVFFDCQLRLKIVRHNNDGRALRMRQTVHSEAKTNYYDGKSKGRPSHDRSAHRNAYGPARRLAFGRRQLSGRSGKARRERPRTAFLIAILISRSTDQNKSDSSNGFRDKRHYEQSDDFHVNYSGSMFFEWPAETLHSPHKQFRK